MSDEAAILVPLCVMAVVVFCWLLIRSFESGVYRAKPLDMTADEAKAMFDEFKRQEAARVARERNTGTGSSAEHAQHELDETDQGKWLSTGKEPKWL